MAEIKIEKKKPVWPWILLVLIILLAAVLYFMYGDRIDDDNDIDDVNTELNDPYDDASDDMEDRISYEDSMNMETSNRLVESYATSVQDTTKLGVDPAMTTTALMNLTKAVEAKATQYKIQDSETVRMLREEVRMVDSTMTASTKPINTKLLRSTGMRVLNVMDAIQKEQFPNLMNDVNDVKIAINDISPEKTLANQMQAVNRFFRESNEVLKGMTNN